MRQQYRGRDGFQGGDARQQKTRKKESKCAEGSCVCWRENIAECGVYIGLASAVALYRQRLPLC